MTPAHNLKGISMGLDMYLTGYRYFRNMNKQPQESRKRGDKMGELIRLGYWRKHPNLHGFIVQTFAGGTDECQEIDLSADGIRQILAAIEADELPETTGFFFGESDGTETDEDLTIFREALAWLEAKDDQTWRSIYYQASW
jgi:hypothetical protein